MVENHKKKKELNLAQYGSIVFTVGLLVAIVAGLFTMGSTATKVVVATLVLAGIFVGALNVTGGESVAFLVASISIVILGGTFLGVFNDVFLSGFPKGAIMLKAIYSNVVAMTVPAAIVVAFKAIFETAKDE